MNPLQRTLIEKAGHDFGFEYTDRETPAAVTLGSARHALLVEVSLDTDSTYRVRLVNPKPLLVSELQRDFTLTGHACACDSIESLASLFKRAAALAHSLPNQAEQDFDSAVAAELDALPGAVRGTEVERMVRQRVGQATYRKAMLEYWNGACAVTNVAIPEILRASHALPWAECQTDAQRLDVFNGFLLTANLDALFDRFLISFDQAGWLMVSALVPAAARARLGLDATLRLRWLTPEHETYLHKHRALLRAS